MKELLTKIVAFLNKAKANLKKAYVSTVAFLKKYGFKIVNTIVLLGLYGAAWDSLPDHRLAVLLGGLWILFLVGKFLFWLFKRE